MCRYMLLLYMSSFNIVANTIVAFSYNKYYRKDCLAHLYRWHIVYSQLAVVHLMESVLSSTVVIPITSMEKSSLNI